jgi:hypothetical protein
VIHQFKKQCFKLSFRIIVIGNEKIYGYKKLKKHNVYLDILTYVLHRVSFLMELFNCFIFRLF